METRKKIRSALISVYYKDQLEPLARLLGALGVTLYSTGGTQDFLQGLGLQPIAVEDLTSFPAILGGRVKTLHPKVFGGILSRRGNTSDESEVATHEIPMIDMVIVDLYPFDQTLASGASASEIIEKIDIGGISLIRAAAKNFNDVLIVSNTADYAPVLELLKAKDGATDLADRKHFAERAFLTSSSYDSSIHRYFHGAADLSLHAGPAATLRYGENPHQAGVFFGKLDDVFEKLNGKELSYNNLLDADAALTLMAEFTAPTVAIVKHNNACGLATRDSLLDAWHAALAGDPVSAFGGVLVSNQVIDMATAQEIHKLFFEILIAPGFEEDALALLKQKTNRNLLRLKSLSLPGKVYRSILNGILEQDRDQASEGLEQMKQSTTKAATAEELADLIFANKIAKHSKSNTIILAKGQQLLGSGVGQTSRVDALKQAIHKAGSFGFDLQGAVMASDAFFPFPDCVEIAHQAGITAVIQPGGSIKDKDSIAYCDAHQLAMVTTGTRHFKH